jgi:hypothetical protein
MLNSSSTDLPIYIIFIEFIKQNSNPCVASGFLRLATGISLFGLTKA